MIYIPTQQEYNITKQRGRILYANIFLLNFNLQRVAELSGVVLNGSISIDATSDIRRTCSISITPKNNSYNIEYGGKIWIDKYVQIYIGMEDTKTKEIVYTNMGIYLINNPEQIYNATNNTITIAGIDMMAKMTGMRNGYLEGIEYQIPVNSSIKGAMTSIIKEAGITKYSVDQPLPTILTPNNIYISVGGTVYDIIAQLRDINSNYQTYFDVDGTFFFDEIPSGDNEQIRVDDDLWEKVLIEYNKNINFEQVKNAIEVYGKTQEDGTVPYGYAEDDNSESPFYINGTAGKIRIVLSGGEYDNIYTTELAQQRADYELYLRCRLQDSLTLTCVPIYWLDVNWLIEITLPNKQGTETKEQYIIKKIETNLDVNGTQTITLMKYYPYLP